MVVQKAIFLLFFVSKVNLLLGNPFPQGNLLRDIDIWHKELKISFDNSFVTSKSLSGALIFASTNPQYDDRLFIELQVQYMKILNSNLGRTCCVQKLFLTFRTVFVHNKFPMFCKKKELLTKIYLYIISKIHQSTI